MGDGQARFGSYQGASQRRVGVAIQQHPIWLFRGEDRFQAFQHFAGLNAVRAGAHFQVVVRPRNRQLFKKHAAECWIVVLTRVDDGVVPLLKILAAAQSMAYYCEFDELGAGAYDRNQPH
jgi:hypothetical protein